MAVYRPVPTCPHCGKAMAKAIHKKGNPSFIGDTFIRWEYNNHSCEGSRKAAKELKEYVETLPKFDIVKAMEEKEKNRIKNKP